MISSDIECNSLEKYLHAERQVTKQSIEIERDLRQSDRRMKVKIDHAYIRGIYVCFKSAMYGDSRHNFAIANGNGFAGGTKPMKRELKFGNKRRRVRKKSVKAMNLK